MTSQRDASYMVSGHATETLSGAERRQLYRAALDDQEIFDQLVEEESWRQIFSSPGVRQELLDVLAEPARSGFFGWLRGIPPLALGASAAALLAVALVPRMIDFGVTGPEDPEGVRPGAPATELIAKGHDPQPGTELVAKSYGGPGVEGVDSPPPASSTRGLQPKSTGSDYMSLSYTLELNQPGGPRQVSDTWAFLPGDQFRLRLGVDFNAWLYLFNRASGDAAYTLLYPVTAGERQPLPSSERDVLLPADVWLTMDDTPEDEQLVLVVSTQPLPIAAAGRETVPVDELNAALERAEDDFGSLNWRRSEIGERVQLTVEEREALVVVLRLLGEGA